MGKSRTVPFNLWEGKVADDNYIRLTSSMLKHPSYINLSASAKELYNYMKDWAEFQKDTFQYSAKLAELFMSQPTFRKARDELVQAGFIYWLNRPKTKGYKGEKGEKNEAGKYQFISTWHDGIEFVPEDNQESLF